MQNAKEENAKEIFAKVLTYFTLIGSVILITLSIFIPDLVKISFFGRSIIGRAYWSGLDVVPIVLLGYLFNGIYIIFTAGIFIKEKSIYVPFIIGFAAIVNIISNFLLIPTIGMMGSAVSALLSYFTMAVGFYIVTQKIYTIQYEIARILKLFLINIFIGSVYYYLFYNNMLTMTFKILLILTFFLLLYIIIIEKKEKAYLLKLIHLG